MPADLKIAIKESNKLGEQIRAASLAGKTCLAQAKWIGLDGYTVFHLIFNCHYA